MRHRLQFRKNRQRDQVINGFAEAATSVSDERATRALHFGKVERRKLAGVPPLAGFWAKWYVFSAAVDPVRVGVVASLNRPGGNVTGMSFLNSEMVGKSAQLLKEIVPAAATIAFLVNPSSPSAEIYAKEAPVAASALGIPIPVLNASTERDLDEAFASLGKLGVGGLVVPADPFFGSQRDRIVTLAARYAVPMISTFREYVVAGGLMSYGASLPDSYRRIGIYVGRVR